MSNDTLAPWPTELRVPEGREAMVVSFDDGRTASLPAEYLRVFTPSAERTGHGARQVIGGKAGVTIKAATPVGHYAVRLVFSDGHETGIYPLDQLMPLFAAYEDNWAAYLHELSELGLSRDRPGSAPAPR